MLIDKPNMIITCKCCGKAKPVSEYYTSNTRGKMYTATMCKDCKKMTGRLNYGNKATRDDDNSFLLESGTKKNESDKKKKKKKKERDVRNQPFFKVSKKCIVYAGFMMYHIKTREWMFSYIPIAKFKLDIECHHFVALAKDYPIELLKIFHGRYRRLKGRTMTLDKAGEIVAKYDIDFGLDVW